MDEPRRVRRALKTLSAGNRSLLRARAEGELLREMCRVIVEVGEYRMAWVGYAQRDAARTLLPMAHAGHEAGFLDRPFTWDGRSRSTFALAVNTGKPSVGRNIIEERRLELAQLRELSLQRGYAAVSSFPVFVEDVVLGNLTIYASEPEAFDAGELELLAELAEDLSFGIATLRTRADRERAEEALARVAYLDPVTGLPNRAKLKEQLGAALAEVRRRRGSLALLVLDIDQFREINEVIGYGAGDRLLRAVGQRLLGLAPAGASLACVGIDEFALLLPQGDRAQAMHLAETVVTQLHEPFELCGINVDVRASIGIALFPGHDHSADSDLLVLRAGLAMHQARQSHGDFAVYAPSGERESLHRLALISDLRHDIEHDHLALYCQPKVDIGSGAVCGAEALLRWEHASHGFIAPERFIPLAEQTGLIRPLTYWVLNAALARCRVWHDAGCDMPLAVNLSARNLRDPNLFDRISALLATWNASPGWLQLELTESALMDDPEGALEVLVRLKKLGLRLFIDDFGTGYSSLSYLHQLPIDGLKIDKSFIHDLGHDDGACVIVRSMVDLGHNLGFEVVAEGIENEATLRYLASIGCNVAQGFYVGRPVPAEHFLEGQRASALT